MIKKIYILLAVLLVGYWTFNFFVKAKQRSVNESNTTTISIDKNIRSLGRVPLNVPASAEFYIKNTGTEPLVIYNIEADCKCTVAEFDKKPINPGEGTKVKMAYDAKALGFFSKKALIKYNSGQGDFVIVIQGEVI